MRTWSEHFPFARMENIKTQEAPLEDRERAAVLLEQVQQAFDSGKGSVSPLDHELRKELIAELRDPEGYSFTNERILMIIGRNRDLLAVLQRESADPR